MSPENPFKGPQPYSENDILYGRNKEKRDLYHLIDNELLTLLFAKSGAGKTSLIKAGLIPYLEREYECLPVYIHLNEAATLESSAKNLSDFVIKCCKQKIDNYIKKENTEEVECKVKLSTDANEISLFEFIYGLQLKKVYKIKSATDELLEEENAIRILLIFDQFEEIFTQRFEKESLHFLLDEIRCLLENKFPSHIDEKFPTKKELSFLKLKTALLSKQKNFRIMFSFREEYLSQFESLHYIFPSIRLTSSRYRLENFSPEDAKEVIKDTAKEINENIAALICDNLVVNPLKNFDKKEVEPFLLSLISYKIYYEIIELKKESEERIAKESEEGMANKVKYLVTNGIENYINHIYSRISYQTIVFIEEQLITSDNKRKTYNYETAVAAKDIVLQRDLEKLIGASEYRLLNVEPYLDAEHIEILHDRLLPPIAKRRDERRDARENKLRDIKKATSLDLPPKTKERWDRPVENATSLDLPAKTKERWNRAVENAPLKSKER
jgi:hypothetical protein